MGQNLFGFFFSYKNYQIRVSIERKGGFISVFLGKLQWHIFLDIWSKNSFLKYFLFLYCIQVSEAR